MRIENVLAAPGSSAFFFDDQSAIKAGARMDGATIPGDPVTPGFRSIRVAGESLLCLLVLEDGQVAAGDCAAVQYSGSGGRDPLFLAREYLPCVAEAIRPHLEGAEVRPFRAMAGDLERLRHRGKRLHTALLYGVSQALLEARAMARGITKCEVLCEEYGLPIDPAPVRLFGQCGDHPHDAVDRMLLKQVDVLPHGLVNNIDAKVGRDGGLLREYVRWIAGRIRALRSDPAYRPTIHIDVYGTIGDLFGRDPRAVAEYLARLEDDAGEFPLYIEGPVDMQGRDAQIEALGTLRARLAAAGSAVRIVADEWCNTLEDIRLFTDAQACDMVQIKTPDLGGLQNVVEAVCYCRAHGMEAYQGGTCNETDVSARACVHAAMAARPSLMLCKPGMGFDEGYMIVRNEMQRLGVLLAHRRAGA